MQVRLLIIVTIYYIWAMQKRYVYILLTENCDILATETSLKKIIEKHGEKLLSYGYLAQLISPAKKKGTDVLFTGKDGNKYKLAARRLQ